MDWAGVTGNDTWTGAATAKTAVGKAGNDTLTAGTGADVLYGGSGDDTFVVNAGYITALSSPFGGGGNTSQLSRIDDGSGIDTIRLSGGASLDLTVIANQAAGKPETGSRIASIEKMDLRTDSAANTLTLARRDVQDMVGMNLFSTAIGTTTFEPRNQLVIDGNVFDTVRLSGGGFASAGKAFNGGVLYDVYSGAIYGARLLINHNIEII